MVLRVVGKKHSQGLIQLLASELRHVLGSLERKSERKNSLSSFLQVLVLLSCIKVQEAIKVILELGLVHSLNDRIVISVSSGRNF